LVQLNQLIVESTDEPHFVRDAALLEMAVNRPIHHHVYTQEDDVAILAGELFLGVARLHPFEEGNKRTAFEGARLFLRKNGYDLAIPDTVDMANLMIEVVTNVLPAEQLHHLFAEFAVESEIGIPALRAEQSPELKEMDIGEARPDEMPWEKEVRAWVHAPAKREE
jgi:death-on-curing protein